MANSLICNFGDKFNSAVLHDLIGGNVHKIGVVNGSVIGFRAVQGNYYFRGLILLGEPCFHGKAKLKNANIRAVSGYNKSILSRIR